MVVPAFVPLQAVKNIKSKTPTSERSVDSSEDVNTCIDVKKPMEGSSTEADGEPKVCQVWVALSACHYFGSWKI